MSVDNLKGLLVPLFEHEPVFRAIVFGSYAKGIPTDQSDVDIVIDSQGKLLGLDFYRVLDKIVETLGIPVDLIEISEIVEDSSVYHEIEREGIVIYERDIA